MDSIGASIINKVLFVLSNGSFCSKLVLCAHDNNVTILLTASAIKSIGDVCQRTPVFDTVFIAGYDTQPSSQPSSSPTSRPTFHPKTKVATANFVGILTIVALIGLFRAYPSLLSINVTKMKKKAGHLYDILVVLSDTEHAILENIKHEDISYFRRTEVVRDGQTTVWLINKTGNVLEKRFEVEFYDANHLLGNRRGRLSENGKPEAITGRIDESSLAVGMIVRVKPAAASKIEVIKDSEDADVTMPLSPMSEHIVRSRGQSSSVLDQLPNCFMASRQTAHSTNDSESVFSVAEMKTRRSIEEFKDESLPNYSLHEYGDEVRQYDSDSDVASRGDDDDYGDMPMPSYSEKSTPHHYLRDASLDNEMSEDSLSIDLFMGRKSNNSVTRGNSRFNSLGHKGNLDKFRVHAMNKRSIDPGTSTNDLNRQTIETSPMTDLRFAKARAKLVGPEPTVRLVASYDSNRTPRLEQFTSTKQIKPEQFTSSKQIKPRAPVNLDGLGLGLGSWSSSSNKFRVRPTNSDDYNDGVPWRPEKETSSKKMRANRFARTDLSSDSEEREERSHDSFEYTDEAHYVRRVAKKRRHSGHKLRRFSLESKERESDEDDEISEDFEEK